MTVPVVGVVEQMAADHRCVDTGPRAAQTVRGPGGRVEDPGWHQVAHALLEASRAVDDLTNRTATHSAAQTTAHT